MFGCDAAQIRRASAILATLASEWRELTVGSEGFLTGGRRGLEDQQVVWGEMDSFVGSPSLPPPLSPPLSLPLFPSVLLVAWDMIRRVVRRGEVKVG